MIRFLLGEMDGKAARSRGCLARGWTVKTNRDRWKHPDRRVAGR